LGLAVDTLSLTAGNNQGAGTFFSHRAADASAEPAVNDSPYIVGATSRDWITTGNNFSGISAIRWLSANGTSTGNPDTGLFSGAFTEFNPLFSKAPSLNGSETVGVRVFGVVLQGYVGQINNQGLQPGGYGFYLRSGNGTLSNALGSQSASWINYGSTNQVLLKQEALLLMPK
jgi:hypothetical protein